MVPNKEEIYHLLRKYAPNDEYYELIKTHGEIVAEIGLECAKNTDKDVDIGILEAACLLHDIGSYPFVGANNFSKDFKKNYPGHAIFGAKILHDEGVDERIWKAVETHVLLGLSAAEIRSKKLALPYKDYFPETVEGRILCYADRFHSKHPIFHTYNSFHENLNYNLPEQAAKMAEWSREFGIPDVEKLAEKYNHPKD